jgi:hypothetical protein
MESDLRLIVLEKAQLGWSFLWTEITKEEGKKEVDWIGVLLLASAFTWNSERES